MLGDRRIWPGAKRSQGGVQFPTGGDGGLATRPHECRERPHGAMLCGVSRPGEIPGPTVTVRMIESASHGTAVPIRRPRACVRLCALIFWQPLQIVEDSMNQTEVSTPLSLPQDLPHSLRFAFVEAAWHADIVHQARDAFFDAMAQAGFGADAIDVFDVPGAFEIPLHAQRLARSGRYAAVVGSALVVDGGIYRHDFVSQTVVQALMDVQLETGVPMISAVLTPHHFHEHAEHRKYFRQHFAVKGTEAAEACLKTVASLRQMDALLAG
jgi:6,7-dimethyl-8-ribityllumazine synthase